MRRSGAILAVMVSVVVAGCTGSGEPEDPVRVGPSTPSVPSDPAMTSADFEEAYRALPMNGTEDLPITWEESEVPDSAELLAARRGLVFQYWNRSVTDWTSVIPIGRFVATDRRYQSVLAEFVDVTDSGGGTYGPLWVKTMGVESTGPDQAMVTFCTDIGYWRDPDDDPPGIRENRANLESYLLTYAEAGDGERRWLTDRVFAKADDPEQEKYGAECEEWAQHTP